MDVKRELDGVELHDIGAVVRDFYTRFPRSRRDTVVDFAADADTLEDAIWRACRSKDANGRHHNHQSRVPMAYLEQLAALIVEADVSDCATFDELHDAIELLRFKGIGPVTVYDVATRIGAWLELAPQSVYLHAGVRAGWETLTRVRSNGVDRLHRTMLPDELSVLPADDVEDILCTYRQVFADWNTQQTQ